MLEQTWRPDTGKDLVLDQMHDLLTLCGVPRWSIVPHIKPQNVAEHSFRVAVIAYALISKIPVFKNYTNEAIKWAILHDAPERFTADIPTPAKKIISPDRLAIMEYDACPWYLPMLTNLRCSSAPVVAVVALADLLEAITFIDGYGEGTITRAVVNQLYSQVGEMVKG